MATLAKLPKTRPSGENKPILPGFDVHIGDLRIDRLAVAPAVTGIARSGRVEARAAIAPGPPRAAPAPVIAGGDPVRLAPAARRNSDPLAPGLHAKGSKIGKAAG